MYPLSRADISIFCFAKNPIKGGTPINENKVIAKLIAIKGFMLKYPFN
jgi:hypothetical protein